MVSVGTTTCSRKFITYCLRRSNEQMCFMMVFSNQPLLVLINKVITNKRAHNTLFGSYIYISAWLPMVFSYVSFIRIGSGRHLELHHQWSLSYWKWRMISMFFHLLMLQEHKEQQWCQLGKEWLLWYAGPSRMTIVGRVYTLALEPGSVSMQNLFKTPMFWRDAKGHL